MPADLLAVFDGDSLAHRAYHAMPPIWLHQGQANHAVYGFGSMLLKALEQIRPRYAAVAFDTPTPTFRHEAFPEYKAQRGAAPDDLYPQFGRIRRVASALGLACLHCEGWEADDLLGTLAHQAAERGMEVVVVTGDTDALQLVGPTVRVLIPVKGLSETLLYDESLVAERYGVAPSVFAALKALRGDPSDNIPGIPGVGPKTAARLLAEHGSVEALLAAAAALPPKLAETLSANADLLRRNHFLTTISRQAPVELEPSACCVHDYDPRSAATALRELGLGRLAGRLPDYRAASRPPVRPTPRPKRRPSGAPELQPTLF
jgi:DNA polymerase I